jgi:ABC-2 type transport system permease protein
MSAARPPAEGSGQVVAAGSAGGSIYDLGYRSYQGPRLGRRHALASLTRHSFRQAYGLGRPARAKIIPIGLLVLATLPAVVALGVAALTERFAGMLGGDLGDANPIRYDTYYPIVAQMVALFAAAQAPELTGRDLRHRVLALYFTRALHRTDYALAKLTAMVLAMLVILLAPQVLIFAGRALVATDIPAAIGRDLPDVLPVVAQSCLTAVMLASLGLAIAAFTPRRAFATAGIIAMLIVPPIIVAVATELAGEARAGALALLSPMSVLTGSNAFFFDASMAGEPGRSLPGALFPVAAIAWIIAFVAVLVWRYRTVEP